MAKSRGSKSKARLIERPSNFTFSLKKRAIFRDFHCKYKRQYKSLIVANYRQNPVKTGFFIFYHRLKSFIVACNRSIFVVCFVVRQPTYYKDYESY